MRTINWSYVAQPDGSVDVKINIDLKIVAEQVDEVRQSLIDYTQNRMRWIEDAIILDRIIADLPAQSSKDFQIASAIALGFNTGESPDVLSI